MLCMTKLLCFTTGFWMVTLIPYNCGSKPPCLLSDISPAVYPCLMWFLWCSQDINEVLIEVFCCISDTVCSRFIWVFLFGFSSGRDLFLVPVSWMHIYSWLLRTPYDFLGSWEKQEEKIQKIFCPWRINQKSMVFRLFYLKGNSFLRRALGSCTSIVTHAAQCNTDLDATGSQEVGSWCGNLPGAPITFSSWDA